MLSVPTIAIVLLQINAFVAGTSGNPFSLDEAGLRAFVSIVTDLFAAFLVSARTLGLNVVSKILADAAIRAGVEGAAITISASVLATQISAPWFWPPPRSWRETPWPAPTILARP